MEIIKNGMFNHIYEVDCFHKEFIQLADEKFTLFPPYPRYQKWLIRSLTILEQQRRHVLRLDGFEQLKNVTPNLYSIRYPHSPLNPRVLYSYLTQNDILLLTAFKEKSKSDYARNTVLALHRLKLVLE